MRLESLSWGKKRWNNQRGDRSKTIRKAGHQTIGKRKQDKINLTGGGGK